MFINWSSYGYKNGEYGALKTGAFKNLLSRTDATVQNNDSREYDMFSCTDYYNYYGGLISARITSYNVCYTKLLRELKRPRYDVMTRASGSFRDAFPNLMDLMNDAVAMVVALDEPPESNILKQNVYSDIQKYTVSGMSQDEAMNEATFRVFSSPPGTYGAGA